MKKVNSSLGDNDEARGSEHPLTPGAIALVKVHTDKQLLTKPVIAGASQKETHAHTHLLKRKTKHL